MISKKYKTPEEFHKDERDMDLKGYHLTYYKLLPNLDGKSAVITATYQPRY